LNESELPESIFEEYRKLGRKITVTRGTYEIPVTCAVDDLDWNHMDQDHRPHVHRTYLEAARIAVAPNFQISVTQLRFFGVPLLIQVSDVRIRQGLFYQCYSLFNLIQIHAVIHSLPGKMYGERYIVSHPILRFLHPFLDRKLHRLNAVQNEEDEPIRGRRAELRNRGYTFPPEERDFVTANLRSNQTRFPEVGDHTVSLSNLEFEKLNVVQAGPVEFLVMPDATHAFSIWPAACPHEGGPLASGKLCGGGTEIICPWHGRKFAPLRLDDSKHEGTLGPFTLKLNRVEGWLQVTDSRTAGNAWE